MLIAPLKPNGLPRPVQIPDMFRAIATSLAVGKVFKSKEALNFLETGAGRTDPRYSQRGLSKDGCAYVVKETQRILEEANALDPAPLTMQEADTLLSNNGFISPDTVVNLKIDIIEFFPSGNRQLILDMIAGTATYDYPHTSIKKGDPMPTHPCFKKVLPLAVALYGKKSKLACHHRTRPVAFVPFTTGVSQGDGTGSGFSCLEAHFAGVETLAHYPNIRVQISAIMDDFHTTSALKHLGPIFGTLSNILKDCAGVQVSIPKSGLNVLQAATIVNPRAAMQLVYEQCPILAQIPLVTEGFICVGTPVGSPSFINNFMAECLLDLNEEFQNLLPYPHPHDFLLFVRFCCNQKIMHLLRHLGPQILEYAHRFDDIIDTLIDDYFDLRLHAKIPLQNIPSDLPALSDVHMSQLARVQLRALPADGGMDLLAMGDVAIPAFYTAHLRHFRQLLQEGEHGPFLPPVITQNLSTSLFSTSFHQAQAALESREAVLVHSEGDILSLIHISEPTRRS